MTALEIFVACRNGQAALERMRKQHQRLRAVGDNVGLTDDAADQLRELGHVIADRERRLQAEMTGAVVMMESLPELEADVAYCYYCESGNIDAFARAKGYSERYIRNVKRRADRLLADMEAAMPEWYCAECEED